MKNHGTHVYPQERRNIGPRADFWYKCPATMCIDAMNRAGPSEVSLSPVAVDSGLDFNVIEELFLPLPPPLPL
jgi:hypothetical protein